MRGSRTFLVVLASVAAMCGGCQRSTADGHIVAAKDPRTFAHWRATVAERMKSDERREFDAMLQEIRLRVMAERAATGAAAIEAELCRRIDGRALRDVIVAGYEAKLSRLEPMRDELKQAIDGNQLLVTKPGDTSSANYIAGYRQRQQERLQKMDAEIDEAQLRLATLGGAARAAELVRRKRERVRDDAAAPLSRDEALAHIAEFIDAQRAAAAFKYGAWPVKIDLTGKQLTGEELAEFKRRKVDAAIGDEVIALHLKKQWWIFDGPVEPPAFSASVVTNLTTADWRAIEASWKLLQAEVWARRAAFDAPP